MFLKFFVPISMVLLVGGAPLFAQWWNRRQGFDGSEARDDDGAGDADDRFTTTAAAANHFFLP